MNNMRITEANQNFTALTKQVDSEGIVAIDKNGKTKYVMMTKERYENMTGSVIYGRRGSELVKVEMSGDRILMTQVYIYEGTGDQAVMRTTDIPANGAEVKIENGKVTVHADIDDLKAVNKGGKIRSNLTDLIMLDDEIDDYYKNDEDGKAEWKAICTARSIRNEIAELSPDNIREMELTVFINTHSGEKYNQTGSLER